VRIDCLRLSPHPAHAHTTGRAEHWGAVSRKKDKKTPTAQPHSKESFRGDARAARGGRGGRGAGSRGAAASRGGRGTGRGGHRAPNGDQAHSPAPAWGSATATETLPVDGPAVKPEVVHENGENATPDSTAVADAAVAPSTASSAAPKSIASSNEVNGTAALTSVVKSSSVPTRTPMTSKLSWAQIARYVYCHYF
jgi:hypothetical protein